MNKHDKMVKILSFDNSSDFNCWFSGIRLAKFGERLRTTFRHLNGRKNECGKYILFVTISVEIDNNKIDTICNNYNLMSYQLFYY